MAVKWTEEQKKVITLRDRNILVSAAAGSGKTAVLVQRILSKIMRERCGNVSNVDWIRHWLKIRIMSICRDR